MTQSWASSRTTATESASSRSAGSKWERTEGGGSYSDAKASSVFVRRASDGANRTQFGREEGFSVRHVSESSIGNLVDLWTFPVVLYSKYSICVDEQSPRK